MDGASSHTSAHKQPPNWPESAKLSIKNTALFTGLSLAKAIPYWPKNHKLDFCNQNVCLVSKQANMMVEHNSASSAK